MGNISLRCVFCAFLVNLGGGLAAAPRTLPPGIYTTNPTDDAYANKMYLSIWEANGRARVGLVCTIPCLPNRKKRYRYSPEAYVGETVRVIEGGTQEIRMRFESAAEKRSRTPASFTLRLRGGDRPFLEFGGGKNFIHAMSFQEAAYHGMGEYPFRVSMLFFPEKGSGEFFLNPAPGESDPEAWLRFSGDSPRARSVRARNWRFALGKSGHELAFFAQLVGELILPDGETAELRMDVIRTPVSDVGLRLTRKGRAPVRFWQANDSNTHELQHCAPATAPANRETCRTLFLAFTDSAPRCPNAELTAHLFILYDPGSMVYELLVDDGRGRLRDARCEPVYDWQMDDEFSRVVLKNEAGPEIVFTRKPE